MFRWKLLLQTVFGLPCQQRKSRRLRRTVRPRLEVLEDRTLLAVQFVQANSETWSDWGPSLSLTFTNNVHAGDLLLVTLGTWRSTDPANITVKDSLGNTYSFLANSNYSAYASREIYAFGAISSSAGPDTITLTVNSAFGDCELGILEYSGVKSSDYLAGTSQNIDESGSATSLTTGTIPVSQSGDAIIGIFSAGGL